ncbi:hypothetical protein D3C86_1120330 [compost metagenome]
MLFGFLALADIEHEPHQRLDFAVLAHHVHHIADPHVFTAVGQRAVVRFMVDPGPGLRDAELHHVIAIVRVHALDPVINANPTVLFPAQQTFDLRPDVTERHGFPVDSPWNRLGRFKQGFVDVAVGFEWIHEGPAP